VNAYEPYYKGRLGYTQAWRVEKPGREYYWGFERIRLEWCLLIRRTL
jgi:hypothetical protein